MSGVQVTFPCDHPTCGRIFTRAFELKKHKVLHDNPDKVFHCSGCDFYTLQKKSLSIHFAKHTGEKIHECPDNILDAPGQPTHRCEYRTNDPAALSKHRQKVHGYIPPPNRARPRLRELGKDETVGPSRRCRRPRPTSLSRRRPTRIPRPTNHTDTIPSIRLEATEGDLVDLGVDDELQYGPYAAALLRDADDEMQLDGLYDPSLNANWMAQYQDSYSMFDVTGMKYVPEPSHPASSSAPMDDFETQTDLNGCLCPEWMVEAGIEGWDASAM